MPTVYLRGDLDRRDDLPDVCARCGALTSNRVRRRFHWSPPWLLATLLAGLPVYLVLVLVMQKSYRVAVPLCDLHEGHWKRRRLLGVVSFFVLFCGGFGLALLLGLLADEAKGAGAGGARDLLLFSAVLSTLGGVVALAVINMTAIRPTEITDHGVRLTHVCEGFADACREQEEAEREARGRALDRSDERARRREDEGERPRRADRRFQAGGEGGDRPRRGRDDY